MALRARRGTEETRPSEPGYSGRPKQSEQQKMNQAYGGMAKVKRAQFIGFNTKGQKVYRLTIQTSMGTHHSVEAWDGSRFHKAGKLKGTKSVPNIPGRGDSGSSGAKEAASLRVVRDRWATNIAASSTLSPGRKEWLRDQLNAWDGDAMGLNSMMDELFNKSIALEGTLPDDDFMDDGFDIGSLLGGGGGGGGGGFTGPTYVAPDRRVVEDQVKGALVSLVGNIPSDEMVDQFTDLYMTDHRRDFDTEDRQIDPAQSVREAIRQTDHYKAIHELRPDSEDERTWVAERRAAAQKGGLTVDSQEDFAITQATAGGDVEDVAGAASVAQLQSSGSAQGTLLEGKIKNVAQSVFSGVR